MNRYGYVKVAAASPQNVYIGSPKKNAEEIKKLIERAWGHDAEIVVFPELCITGYTCGDLFNQDMLLDEAEDAINEIALYTADKGKNTMIVVGAPIRKDNALYNCAVVINNGKVIAVVPKTHIPNYNEFYEMRYFKPATDKEGDTITLAYNRDIPFRTDIIFEVLSETYGHEYLVAGKTKLPICRVGIEICEDAWAPITPGARHCVAGADIILNLSASNELAAKRDYRRNIVKSLSAQEISGYVYASASTDESTSDTVYSGHCIIAENGSVLNETEFLEDREILYGRIDVEKLRADRKRMTSYMQIPVSQHLVVKGISSYVRDKNVQQVSITPFIPKNIGERAEEILNIQAAGLAQRLRKTGITKTVIGISGGLDSTLALLAVCRAYDILGINEKKGIIGITMPCFGTTERTKNNSIILMEQLGVTSRTIDIKAACEQHLKDIEHPNDVYDVTYENVQARERTQVLMDVANAEGALVIGTGDLSEIALGWCTYNGDHMSMYAVNSSIPKTLVRHLINYVMLEYKKRGASSTLTDCLKSILDTPVSPELLPPNEDGTIAQKTEESIGNYVIHDFTMYYMMRYGFRPGKIFEMFYQSAIETPGWDKITKAEIKKDMLTFYRRFFSQQFKRNCMPDGIKVGSISLSPRADWRMPADATAQAWLEELEKIKVSDN